MPFVVSRPQEGSASAVWRCAPSVAQRGRAGVAAQMWHVLPRGDESHVPLGALRPPTGPVPLPFLALHPPRSPWERPAWSASKGLGERADSGKGTGDDSPRSRAAQRDSSTWCCPLQPFPIALCCSARWQRRGRCPLTCLGIGPWLLSPGAPQQPGCATAQDGSCSRLLEPGKVADLHMGLHG